MKRDGMLATQKNEHIPGQPRFPNQRMKGDDAEHCFSQRSIAPCPTRNRVGVIAERPDLDRYLT